MQSSSTMVLDNHGRFGLYTIYAIPLIIFGIILALFFGIAPVSAFLNGKYPVCIASSFCMVLPLIFFVASGVLLFRARKTTVTFDKKSGKFIVEQDFPLKKTREEHKISDIESVSFRWWYGPKKRIFNPDPILYLKMKDGSSMRFFNMPASEEKAKELASFLGVKFTQAF